MSRVFEFVLRLYKATVSPLLGPACRYVPSCSEYAVQAVERHGIARGGLMALWRIVRCNPLARGGYDPLETVAESLSTSSGTRSLGSGKSV